MSIDDIKLEIDKMVSEGADPFVVNCALYSLLNVGRYMITNKGHKDIVDMYNALESRYTFYAKILPRENRELCRALAEKCKQLKKPYEPKA